MTRGLAQVHGTARAYTCNIKDHMNTQLPATSTSRERIHEDKKNTTSNTNKAWSNGFKSDAT
eukprot:5494886-Alexandrium_andersonii.AAC.1